MDTSQPDIRALFCEALDRKSPDEVAQYLDAACGGDAQLRAQVEDLLASHREGGNFLGGSSSRLETLDQPPVEMPGTQIGPYKLLQQIGEGGMGVVYMAEQEQPVRRRVALKIIKPGMDTRQVIARFEAERQALSLMDHPNIAKVLDAGTTGSEKGDGSLLPERPEGCFAQKTPVPFFSAGCPYFVMELVRGTPITQYCDEHHLTPRQRLELLVPVCQAIQHAHQKGIIHRDIKPTNILVAEYDEKPVPKVIDFGVAKAIGSPLTEKTMFTGFGQLVGTLEYMSPEQAKVNQLDIDTRSDIYSLGVLMYELLTGSTPFDKHRLRSAAWDEMLRIIREEEPEKPSTRLSESRSRLPDGTSASRSSAASGSARQAEPTLASIAAVRGTEPAKLTKLLRGELDWIVMKALEKDRGRRYETANGFAMDVQRYLNDDPVQACPPSVGYRLRKLVRRHRGPVLAVSLVVLGLVGGIFGTTWGLIRATDAQEKLRRDSYFHRISLAHRDLSADNLGRALKLLEECPEDLREWEWHYLMRLSRFEPLVLHDMTEVNGLAFSPDGQRLASAGGDGAVKIWNSKTGEGLQTINNAHNDAVLSVAFHRDGQHLASFGADRKVKVWDLTATDRPVFTGPCDTIRKFGMAYSVAFSPDGRALAAGSEGTVRLWDWKNDRILYSWPGREGQAIPVAFSGDGRRLASVIFRKGLQIWDPETERLLLTIEAHRQPVSALAFSPDDQWLASASYDRTVKLSDATTGALVGSFPLHTGNVECVAFSASGKRLASGGEDKTVRFWDATTGLEVLGLRGHTDRCGCVAFSPDGWRLASASSDRTIRIWDATPLQGDEGQEILTFQKHTDEIRSVAFSPISRDGQRIASAGTDGLVKVWDATTGQVSVSFIGHAVIVFSLAWHPDGKRIATAEFEGRLFTVKVWDARTGREVFELPAGESYITVAFSPDGRYLVTGSNYGAVQVWDAENGQEVEALGIHSVEIRGIAFSPDGKHLASASGDGKVKLWDAKRLDQKQDGRLLTDCARVPGPSVNVAFSPDGRRLATGGEDNTVKIWDVESGEELQTLKGHTGEVYTVAFNPVDGRWVASGGGDSTVKVWDSHTGKFVRGFRGHKGIVSSVAFSPDGSRLVSGSRDKTVKVWDVSQLDGFPNRPTTTTD